MKYKHYISFLFSIFFFTHYSQYQIRNYYSLTGKKDVPVNVIAQDHDGYLWLGTKEGVFRFDGKSAEHLFNDYAQLKTEINALHIDTKGVLWLGLKSGKVYCVRKNSLDSVEFGDGGNTSRITSFSELGNRFCIGTYGNGMYILENRALSHYTSANGLSDDVVYRLTNDKMNRLWCATDAGITEFDFSSSQAGIHIISNKSGLPDNIVRDISLYSDQLCIAMQDSGICYYNLRTKQIERKMFFTEWSLGPVLNAFTDISGKTILATEKQGLLIVRNSNLNVFDYETQMQCKEINQAFLDREQQIWIASKKGISQFTEKRHQLINKFNGLENEKVLALAIDNDQSIWVGSTSGVTKILKDERGELKVQTQKLLKKFSISCAVKAPDGDIWFGTYGQGIIVLDTKTDKTINLVTTEDKISDNNISHLFFENEHTLYISTLGGGLIKAQVDLEGDRKRLKIDAIYTEENGFGSNYVYAAITDKNGVLYAATDGSGLGKLQNNRFINLTKKYQLNSNTVFSLCRDNNNAIWAISNAEGLLRYDGKTIQKFGQKDGLRDDQPQQIICAESYIYCVHNKGIDRLSIANGKVSYFDLNTDDLEPNLNAIVLHKNTLYSGTGSGILVLRTNKEAGDSIAPKISLKLVELNYKPLNHDSVNTFDYNQNTFGFTYDGIWMKNPGKLRYRHKLHGFEQDWVLSDEGKRVMYNKLDPGYYTFIAQVQNEEEIWSEPVTYAFLIATPFWKRWWFWVLSLGLATGGIYLFIRYRLRALQRENLILETKVKERTAEIEKQSRIIEHKNVELEQLSLVASKTDNVVLILDALGQLEYINESFIKLHGLNMEELIVKYGNSIYNLSNHPRIQEIIKDAVANKKSVNYETLNNKTKQPSAVWQSSTLTPIFDSHGALKKIIIIDTDVTERKIQEQIIIQKNKDITDSIAYARKIQYSILPPDAQIANHLPDSFLIYLTKDIVSGDFYWFTHFENTSIIAAVDCTGHGVPGAFMSLIGYNLLNKIVNEQKITNPADILLALNQGVLDALYKNETESKDGMDIAICKINHQHKNLEYAGAMRPLWVIENNELNEIKADKIPIGTKQKDRAEAIRYTTHNIPLHGNTRFYIFTDGYADQFGGPREKKYSTGKFKELLLNIHTRPMQEQSARIRNEHIEWKGRHEQVDDILVIGFKL